MDTRTPRRIDEIVIALAEALGTISPAVAHVSPERVGAVEAAVGDAGVILMSCSRSIAEAAALLAQCSEALRSPVTTKAKRKAIADACDTWIERHLAKPRTLH